MREKLYVEGEIRYRKRRVLINHITGIPVRMVRETEKVGMWMVALRGKKRVVASPLPYEQTNDEGHDMTGVDVVVKRRTNI